MTDIDEKIEEAERLFKEGKTEKFEELLSELFLEQHGKLAKEQKDRLEEVFARSRDVEFKEALQKADELYRNGEWQKAVDAAMVAMSMAVMENNDEHFAEAQNKRGWSKRYIGYKSSDLTEREKAYEIARKDWRSVLEKSRDINTRISAIKGLILLPDEDIQQWCNAGMQEAEKSELVFQDKENIKAELGNSKAIDIRKTDPEKALDEFLKCYETVQHGTVISGHLMQNAGTCWLILKDKAKNSYWKLMFATRAIPLLEKAFKEYPTNQIEHRKSTQKKIDKTKEEIKILKSQQA